MPLRHWVQCRQGVEVNAAKALRSMPQRHWVQCCQGIEFNAAKALSLMPPRHWSQCCHGIEINVAKTLRPMPTWHWIQCLYRYSSKTNYKHVCSRKKNVAKRPSSTHLTQTTITLAKWRFGQFWSGRRRHKIITYVIAFTPSLFILATTETVWYKLWGNEILKW